MIRIIKAINVKIDVMDSIQYKLFGFLLISFSPCLHYSIKNDKVHIFQSIFI